MKKIACAAALAALLATPALAADMLVKKAPPAAIPTWNWTGFYVGANLGGGWAGSYWFEDVSGSGGGGPSGFQDASIRALGVLGGGQIGFDYQTGWAVFGIQADADAAGINGSTGCFPQVSGIIGVISSQQSCSVKINSMGTVTGRIGAAFDRTLYYALAGFAWEHERLENPATIQTTVGTQIANPEFSGTTSGATVGAGIERVLTGNWSAFVQYNYMGFGRRALVFTDTLGMSPPFTESFAKIFTWSRLASTTGSIGGRAADRVKRLAISTAVIAGLDPAIHSKSQLLRDWKCIMDHLVKPGGDDLSLARAKLLRRAG